MNGNKLDAIALTIALALPASLQAIDNRTLQAVLMIVGLLVVFVIAKFSTPPQTAAQKAKSEPPPPEPKA